MAETNIVKWFWSTFEKRILVSCSQSFSGSGSRSSTNFKM